MKHTVTYALGIATLITTLTAVAQEITVPLAFAAADVQVQRGTPFATVRLRDLPCVAGAPDAPALPVATVNVLLPAGEEYADCRATITGELAVDRAVTLASAAKPQIAAAPALQATVTYAGTRTMRGARIAQFLVSPLRYAATERALYLAQQLTLTVTTKAATSSPRNLLTPAFADAINALVANPDPALAAASATRSGLVYVIVTSDELAPAFQELADYRAAMFGAGRVAVVTVSNIEQTVGGNDTAAKIHNFLTQMYFNAALDYALLGGDASIIPAVTMTVEVVSGKTLATPSDQYYAEMNSETLDVVAPDICVSRLPVATSGEVTGYIHKLKAAESGTRMAVAGTYLLSGSEQVEAYYGNSRGYDTVNDGSPQFRAHEPVSDSEMYGRRIYRDDAMLYYPGTVVRTLFDTVSSWDVGSAGTYRITGPRLRDRLNMGWEHQIHVSPGATNAFVFFDGEAGTGLFTYADAAGLTGLVVSIVSVSDYDGAFDLTQAMPLCRAFIGNGTGGALVYIGNARQNLVDDRIAYGGPAGVFALYYHDRLFRASPWSNATYGLAYMMAKFDYVALAGANTYDSREYGWAFMSINMFGDPAVAGYAPARAAHMRLRIPATSVRNVGGVFWTTPKLAVTPWLLGSHWRLRARALSNIRNGVERATGASASNALFEIVKTAPLCDMKTTRRNIKSGMLTHAALVQVPAVNVALRVSATTQAGQKIKGEDAGTIRMVQPAMQAVACQGPFAAGSVLTISGVFFGAAPPKVYIEVIKNRLVKWVACAVRDYRLYHNAAGAPYRSCMEPDSGLATVYCLYPTLTSGTTPTGWVVLEAPNGLAVFPADVND